VSCCEGVVNVEVEERCEASNEMCLDQFFTFIVNVFFGAESQVVEN
jgi:hypothetical protein